MNEKLRRFKAVDGLLLAGFGLIAIGVGLNLKANLSGPPVRGQKVEIIEAKVTPTIVLEKALVVFDMAGEVVKPGVYKLTKGSRVEDALLVSGGLAVNADRSWVEKNLNRAAPISDGMKIYIPKIGEKQVATASQVLGSQVTNGNLINGLININLAGAEELEKLPGVGPVMAGRMIDYRIKNGGFKDINELKLVTGIGDKMFEKIKDSVEI